jgi:hypothetical protein
MLTKSPAELLRSRDRLAGAHGRATRRDVRVRSVAMPRVRRSGDTDALDWHSDSHLLAILARSAKRERETREKDQFPWRPEELDQPDRQAGASPCHPHSHPQEVHSDAYAVRSVPRA